MLEITNLNFEYDNKEVFQNASFILEDNDIIHLQGENGVGKTTFYKIMSGILKIKPNLSTKINLDGNLIDMIDLRHSVNYIPSIPYLFDYLNGLENIDYLLTLFKMEESRDDIMVNLKKLGLCESLDKDIFKYSLGMKSKLYLGVMIERKCPILIIDELMSNLDRDAQNYVLNLIQKKLKESRLSIIMSSHTSTFDTFEGIKKVTIVDKRFSQNE